MKYARFDGATVQEVIAFNPAGMFTPEVAALFSEVPEDTGAGDVRNGDGTWTKAVTPPPIVEPTPLPPPVDPAEWLIDIGPFYDRFVAAKMAVLTSTDAGVKAIMSDVSIRKWIDLKRSDVASSLAYIGTKVPAVDATLQAAILDTPVAPEENLALRKLYFS